MLLAALLDVEHTHLDAALFLVNCGARATILLPRIPWEHSRRHCALKAGSISLVHNILTALRVQHNLEQGA